METRSEIGNCDVVLCSGVLYHTPDPFHLLLSLHSICKERLILNTASIPEMYGIRNASIFYPYLSDNQRQIWKMGFGEQKAITRPYEPESGYGNWFWGFTPSALRSMLKCSGFEIEKEYISSFKCIFICKVVSTKFVAESGEWTTPKSGDSLKFRN